MSGAPEARAKDSEGGPAKAPVFRFRRGLLLSVAIGAIVAFITLLALSYAYPALTKLQNAPPPAEWTQKMERLGVALVYYAVRNEGRLPAKLSELHSEGYAKDLSLFDASDAPGSVRSEAEIDSPSADFLYLLPPGSLLTGSPQAALKLNYPPGRILLISKKGLSWDSNPEGEPSASRAK